MKKIEKLYEVLGELLYAIAKADGIVQSEEKERLKELFNNHAFGSDIVWSFEYEVSKSTPIDEIYNKVINFCHSYGPAPQYDEFIKAMKIIAEAADGIQEGEAKIIESFSKDLLERFQRDTDKLRNYQKDLSE
ncbi:TerB family tellurite resistance protein [Carboxylicivirga sp. M1479]|uniref:TerB family tellurite resistance protein n=1 Tax=Carboxylicivirga sp. M1479 TaxID=2594476 RepID=UPI0011786B97|nr:TerB family tellurite resistance protein [Carboxylicivirga sp. M1479]TRX66384.1 TerB family tellurite resistance protein [Carboxylicivirga sp. M1479]